MVEGVLEKGSTCVETQRTAWLIGGEWSFRTTRMGEVKVDSEERPTLYLSSVRRFGAYPKCTGNY